MEGKTCCVTGHRDIPAEETAHVKEALRREIGKAVNDGFTVFLSGFADGVDQYFAEMILELQNKKSRFETDCSASIPETEGQPVPERTHKRPVGCLCGGYCNPGRIQAQRLFQAQPLHGGTCRPCNRSI